MIKDAEAIITIFLGPLTQFSYICARTFGGELGGTYNVFHVRSHQLEIDREVCLLEIDYPSKPFAIWSDLESESREDHVKQTSGRLVVCALKADPRDEKSVAIKRKGMYYCAYLLQA